MDKYFLIDNVNIDIEETTKIYGFALFNGLNSFFIKNLKQKLFIIIIKYLKNNKIEM